MKELILHGIIASIAILMALYFTWQEYKDWKRRRKIRKRLRQRLEQQQFIQD